LLRDTLGRAQGHSDPSDPLASVQTLLVIQQKWSLVPNANQFLVEHWEEKNGMRLYFYPFEGRVVHEILASLVAWRIAQVYEATFSIAMNDYGFELACDQKMDVEELLSLDLFSTEFLRRDLEASMNKTDMARRRFRDVATISGLVFTGMPGQRIKDRHLQGSSNLLYDVFRQYEPDNLLFLQAHDEVFNFEVEESRIVSTLERIQQQEFVLRHFARPTPFAFNIYTAFLREKLAGESLENQIQRLLGGLEKALEDERENQLEDFASKH
jgi:ATP-dependent Lhr-like helicase